MAKRTRRRNSRKRVKGKTYLRKSRSRKKTKMNRRKKSKQMNGGSFLRSRAVAATDVPDICGGARHAEARANPVWIVDEQYRSACMICEKGFGLTTRRHHCRYCGWIICSSCKGGKLEVDRWLDDDEPHKIKIPSQDEDHEKVSKKVCVCCATHAPGEMDSRPYEPLWGVNFDNVDKDSILFGPSEIPSEEEEPTWHPKLPGNVYDYEYRIVDGPYFRHRFSQTIFDQGLDENPGAIVYSYLMTYDGVIYAFSDIVANTRFTHGRLANLLVDNGIVTAPIFLSAGEIHLDRKYPHQIISINNGSGHFKPSPVSCMFLLNELKDKWKGAGNIILDGQKIKSHQPYIIDINIIYPDQSEKTRRIQFGTEPGSYGVISDTLTHLAVAPMKETSSSALPLLPTSTGDQGCKVQGCTEDHSKHYCKWCKDADSDHFSSNCQRNPNKK